MRISGSIRNGIRSSLVLAFLLLVVLATPADAATSGSLAVNPTSLAFGSVSVGSSQVRSLTLTNLGKFKLTVTAVSLSGAGFTLSGLRYPLTLNGGQSATCTLTFTPLTGGAGSGSVSIFFTTQTSNRRWNSWGYAPSTLSVPMSGTAVASGLLTPAPVSLNFSSVPLGSTQTLWETITNSSGVAVNISQASVAGSGFGMSGLTPPLSLNPGQSVTFGASFAPLSGGSASGNMTLVSDASNPTLTIPLTGTGLAPGQLSLNPASFNFGNVTVGATVTTPAVLSASTANVTVTSVTLSNSEFNVNGFSLPFTIPAGQSVPLTASFAPQASGLTSATVSFTSNASNSPLSLTLSGSGTAPVAHAVDLSWGASSSQSVSGYNIYRSTVSGGPYTRVNSSLTLATNYTDSSVVAGQTYYYVTTAVNSNNQESPYSNQANAAIPSP